MKRSIIVVLVSTCSAPALADGSSAGNVTPRTEHAREAEESTWSVGAGLALSGLQVAGSPMGSLGGLTPGLGLAVRSRTTGNVGVEHALSSGTWLLLDLMGGYDRQSGDDAPEYLGGRGNGSQGDAAAIVGLRRIVSRSAIADLSVWGGLGGSWSAGEYDARTGANLAIERWKSSARSIGLSAGVAIDRELLDALSVRISLTMAEATYLWTRTERAGYPRASNEALQGWIGLSPALQLRLAI